MNASFDGWRTNLNSAIRNAIVMFRGGDLPQLAESIDEIAVLSNVINACSSDEKGEHFGPLDLPKADTDTYESIFGEYGE